MDIVTLAASRKYTDKKIMESGAVGIKSDWNQNDATQPDYIKNRPFYTGDPVETVLVEETTIPFKEGNGGIYTGLFETMFLPIVGETYKISWDGSVYESTCVKFYEALVIGNLSIAGEGSDTGEPFLFLKEGPEGFAIGTADTAASHTISISSIVTPVVKIDPKYIRDMYYTGDPVETVLVEESIVSFAANGDVYRGELESTFVPTVGETYKVHWDGTVYECTCIGEQNTLTIGNLSIVGEGSDTGEPFVMGVNVKNGSGIMIYTADTSASHTISISATVTSVVKIDEKYLPDTVANKSDVEDAKTTADNAQTTADNAKTAAENAQSIANAAKTAAENAQTTATNAQTTASAKFQLMQQNTVTTTTTIGTIRNGAGSVPVKGLNIAVGSTIKFTADNNVSCETVWDRPVKQIYMKNSVGAIVCLLGLELSHDGETYNFTNKTNASILSNLVIEYEKVIIPKITYPSRNEGAWLPPYLIANCLYLTKPSTSSTSATLYRITVGDSGIIKTVNISDGTVTRLARTSDIQNAVTEKISNLNKADTAVDGKYVSAVTESNGIINVTRANLPDIPTDNHINELINAALNAIGVAEEGAY